MECYKEERRMKEYKSRIPYEHDNIPGIRVTLNLRMPVREVRRGKSKRYASRGEEKSNKNETRRGRGDRG